MSDDDIEKGESSKPPASALLSLKEESQALEEEFIDAYMRLPELWDPENAHYTNKTKRNAASDVLLQILKRWNPEATRHDVGKKINVLRSSYRKDLKKHLASKCVAPNGEEIYEYWPKSWKFHAMRFLDQVKTCNKIMEVNVTSQSFDYEDSEDNTSEVDYGSGQASDTFELITETNRGTKRRHKRPKVEMDALAEYYSGADQMLDREMEAIGANVTCKLKRMNSLQRYHAELLINKVLINGLKGNLTDDTELTEVNR